MNKYEYDLILKYDYGTNLHTQWYYFSVGNTRKGKTYKINLINLIKPESSYNEGMKPLLYSTIGNKLDKKNGWYRMGQNVCYE